MKWLLVAVIYTITQEDVPHEVRVHEIAFGGQTLCEMARTQMEEQLKTRAITVRATCVQVSD